MRHAPRGGPRHRAGPRIATRAPSASTSTSRRSPSGWRPIGAELLVDTLADGVDALPAGDARRTASPPTPTRCGPRSCASTGPAPPSSSNGWCAWTGRGPRSAASACGCSTPWPARARPRSAEAHAGRDGPGSAATGTVGRAPVTGCSSSSRSSRPGSVRMAASAWCRGVRVQPGETLGDERSNAGRLGADAADRPFGAVGRLRQPGRGRGRGGSRGRLAARGRHGRPLRPQPDHRPTGGGSRCAGTRGCSSTAIS